MSDRLPRRGDWMGYEGAYVCGRGWLPIEEAKEWLKSVVSREKNPVVVNAQEKHNANPGPHRSVDELKP